MSAERRQVPEPLRPHLTQEQYDRAREYLRTPHTRVDLTPEEWDDVINGRGWPARKNPDYAEADPCILIADLKGSRVEREAAARPADVARWRCPKAIEVRDFPFARWADFRWAMRHPVLWLKHRRRVYRGLGEEPALSGWKAIDPKAPASVAAFAPAAFVLPDPLPARYASLEDAMADMAEGTRKRAIRPYDKVGGRVFLRREYRDAPIGVGTVWGREAYAVAYRETE